MQKQMNKNIIRSQRDEYLTAYDVRDLLNLDLNTVYSLLRKGKMPGKKIGHQWRIPSDQFESYLERNQNDY